MRHTWNDSLGDIGSLYTAGGEVHIRLSEDRNDDEDGDSEAVSVQHSLPPGTAHAFYTAMGDALEELGIKPATAPSGMRPQADTIEPILERMIDDGMIWASILVEFRSTGMVAPCTAEFTDSSQAENFVTSMRLLRWTESVSVSVKLESGESIPINY